MNRKLWAALTAGLILLFEISSFGQCSKAFMLAKTTSAWENITGFRPLIGAETNTKVVYLQRDFTYSKNSNNDYTSWELLGIYWVKMAIATNHIQESSGAWQTAVVNSSGVANITSFGATNYYERYYYATNLLSGQNTPGQFPDDWGSSGVKTAYWIGPADQVVVTSSGSKLHGESGSSTATVGGGPTPNLALSDFSDISYTNITETVARGGYSYSYSGFGFFLHPTYPTVYSASGAGSKTLTLSEKKTALDVTAEESILGRTNVTKYAYAYAHPLVIEDSGPLRTIRAEAARIDYEIYVIAEQGVKNTVRWKIEYWGGDNNENYHVSFHEKEIEGNGGEVMAIKDHYVVKDGSVQITLLSVANDCGCVFGEILTSLSSAEAQFPLGHNSEGDYLGALRIHEELPSAALYTPAKLGALLYASGAEVINDAGGIRQVKAIECFVDVVVISSNKYEIRYYNPLSSGATTNGSGLYSPSGSINVLNVVESYGGDTNKLRLTNIKGGATNISEFEYSSTDGGWWLITGGGAKKEFLSKEYDEIAGITTKTRLVKNAGNQLLSKEVTKLADFGEDYGQRIIEETSDPDGLAKTTRWYYYDDAENDGASYSKQKMVIYPTGRWERYQYDQFGRETNIVAQFGNAATNAAESLSRVTQYTYVSYNTNLDKLTLQTNVPRRTIVKLLGEEIGRSYRVFGTNEEWSVQCQTPGASIEASDNLKTVTKTYLKPDFDGHVISVLNPDGTMTISEEPNYSRTNNITRKVYTGAPNGAGTEIVDGTLSMSVTGTNGLVLSTASYDIVSGVQLSGTANTYDSNRRLTRVDYLDGTYTLNSYGCCNLESSTDKNGLVTSYVYDSLKRQIATIRNGITYSNWLDADGRVLASYKIAGGTTIVTERKGYDGFGNLVAVTNALGYVTQYLESVDGSGQAVKTTRNPDGGTQIRTSFKDGFQKNLTGTAVHGVRYDYGVETVDGIARAYTKQILLETNGTDTAEWVKTYTDMVGRTIKTVYPDDAASRQFYNAKGQLWKTMDPDNVTMLYQFNAKGEQEYSALDMDRDDEIDFAGTDRVTRSVRDVLETPSIVNLGSNLGVVRSRMYRWEQDGTDAATLVSTSESSVDGKRSWSSMAGLVSSSRMVYGSEGWQYVTNTAPDGSYTVQESQYGQMKAVTRRDANHGQLGRQTYLYDRFERLLAVTDARNGGSVTLYDVLDRPVVQAVNLGTVSYNDGSAALSHAGGSTTIDYTDPYAVSGFPTNAQVMTTWLTTNGLPWHVQQPDGTSVTNEYFATGKLYRTYGSRTYPVEHGYDYAGRMKTLKTWQDFTGNSGTAMTIWNYSTNRAFMLAKRYADNQGPNYEYSAAGRLSKRTWARGVVTDYGYNNAGDLVSVNYGDETPDVTYNYDRVGRRKTVVQGTQDAVVYSYNTLGFITGESHTSGLLGGITVTNTFDAYGRRLTLSVFKGTTNIYRTGYGYDAASRLQMVSQNGQDATYAYHTNSAFVESVTFRKFGEIRLTTVNGYDSLNRVTNIVSTPSGAGESPISYSYQYNTANQRTKATEYDGRYWDYAYDSLGQATNGVKKFASGTAINGMGFEYQYDDIGNRKNTTLQSRPTTRTGSYAANLLNQYTNRTVPGVVDIMGVAHTNAVVTVSGNTAIRQNSLFWQELTPNNTNTPVWEVVTNRAVLVGAGSGGSDVVRSNVGGIYLAPAAESFTYDIDGNLTQDGRWAYTWDAENRLIQMQTTTMAASAGVPNQRLEFVYDYGARRIQKRILEWNGSYYSALRTNRFIHDKWNLLIEMQPDGLIEASYLWGADTSGQLQSFGGAGGLLSANVARQASVNFVCFDGSGNVSALIDASTGKTSTSYEYDVFGNSVQKAGTYDLKNPFGFSTKYLDEESGFIYFGYRYYSPQIGRWLSRDLIGESGGDNLYGFIRNDGVNYLDMLGLQAAPVTPPTTLYEDVEALATLEMVHAGVALFPNYKLTKMFLGNYLQKGGDLALPAWAIENIENNSLFQRDREVALAEVINAHPNGIIKHYESGWKRRTNFDPTAGDLFSAFHDMWWEIDLEGCINRRYGHPQFYGKMVTRYHDWWGFSLYDPKGNYLGFRQPFAAKPAVQDFITKYPKLSKPLLPYINMMEYRFVALQTINWVKAFNVDGKKEFEGVTIDISNNNVFITQKTDNSFYQ